MVKWFILCGNKENLNAAIKAKVWGTKLRLSRLWDRLSKGDIVFFYPTRSLMRIIGVGTVQKKLDPQTHQPKPLWPDEISKGQVIYPYRFKFETIYVCENSLLEGISINGLTFSKMRGMSRISDKQSVLELQRRVNANWNVDILLPEDIIVSSD